jgi:hypothetical protein
MKSTPGSLLPRQSVPHDIINLSPPLGLRLSSTPLSFFRIQNEWSFLLPKLVTHPKITLAPPSSKIPTVSLCKSKTEIGGMCVLYIKNRYIHAK